MNDDFGFLEKKITDFEKKIIIGRGDTIFEFMLYLPYHVIVSKPFIILIDDIKSIQPYIEKISERGYSIFAFSKNVLETSIKNEFDILQFEIGAIFDYIDSFDIFDKSEVIFSNLSSSDAYLPSDKRISKFIKYDEIKNDMQ